MECLPLRLNPNPPPPPVRGLVKLCTSWPPSAGQISQSCMSFTSLSLLRFWTAFPRANKMKKKHIIIKISKKYIIIKHINKKHSSKVERGQFYRTCQLTVFDLKKKRLFDVTVKMVKREKNMKELLYSRSCWHVPRTSMRRGIMFVAFLSSKIICVSYTCESDDETPSL